MKNTKISFIGCGNMGRSLIGGLISNGYNANVLRGSETDPVKAQDIENTFGIKVYEDNTSAIKDAKIVILAVKPQNLLKTLSNIANQVKQDKSVVISIAAGVRIQALESILGIDHPIIRVMPNTPALIRAGASSMYANQSVTNSQREMAEEIMRSVGITIWLDNELLMDTVTALSCSGPAYFFLLMQAMEKAAIKLGLPIDQARLLTLETALGASKMAINSEVDTATLQHRVTSPGGTTEAAIQVLLEQGNFEELILDALTAAQKKSQEIAETIGSSA
jgi:pyrroline-5-carboxylate reductase